MLCFIYDFLKVASCPCDSSKLSSVSIAHFFASLNNISQCDAIDICSSTHLHMDIWYVSSLSLVRTKAAANIHAQVHLQTCIFISFGLTLRIGMFGYGFNYRRKCQIVFQSEHANLQSPTQGLCHASWWCPSSYFQPFQWV